MTRKAKSTKPLVCEACQGMDLIRRITTYPVRLTGPLEGKQIEGARAKAEEERLRFSAEAERARLAAAAEDRSRQAGAERLRMRDELRQQLNIVLQTGDSARGLIVNMSDVLFDTAQSTLRPGAREKLAKVAGIILPIPISRSRSKATPTVLVTKATTRSCRRSEPPRCRIFS